MHAVQRFHDAVREGFAARPRERVVIQGALGTREVMPAVGRRHRLVPPKRRSIGRQPVEIARVGTLEGTTNLLGLLLAPELQLLPGGGVT